ADPRRDARAGDGEDREQRAMKVRARFVERLDQMIDARLETLDGFARVRMRGRPRGLRRRGRRGKTRLVLAAVDPEFRQRLEAVRAVAEDGRVAAEGIGEKGDLRFAGEEILLDELVHRGELDAEAGMRVVPADDLQI